jgi:hypothetical protein
MKKTFIIFLSFLYLVLSCGFTTNTHFCKGIKQETSFVINHDKEKQCPKCAFKKLQKTKKCCEHKTQLIKLTEKVQLAKTDNLAAKFFGDAFRFYENLFEYNFPQTALRRTIKTTFFIPIRSNPLYIFYCVYRI